MDVSSSYQQVKQEVESYKKTSDTVVFIHIARYNVQKNQLLLIESFNHLVGEGFDFTLLVIGNGYDCLEGRRLQLLADDRVFFLGEKNNVNDYLLCSDAFCLTSKYEGLPISLLEALSCGVTPVCTSVGGIPDVITEGVTGYLSEGESIESYCNAIKRFFLKPISRDRLIAYYKANYSMEICAQKYEELYEQKL